MDINQSMEQRENLLMYYYTWNKSVPELGKSFTDKVKNQLNHINSFYWNNKRQTQ